MDTNNILMLIGDKLPQDYTASQTIRSHLDKLSDEQKDRLLTMPLKSPMATLMYAIFLGIFGVDMFYLQQQTKALFKLGVCFATPFLASLLAVIFEVQSGGVADTILMIIWAVSSCAAIIWWIKDIIFASKSAKKQNFDTLMAMLLQISPSTASATTASTATATPATASTVTAPATASTVATTSTAATSTASVLATSANATSATTASTANTATASTTSADNSATANTDNSSANTDSTAEEKPEQIQEKPKTLWGKTQAFFKNPIVIVIMAALVIGMRYYKVNRASSSIDYREAQEAYQEQNYEKALELYEEVCTDAKFKMHKSHSCYHAGTMYEKGLGTEKNPQKAYEIYSKYCDEDEKAELCNAAFLMLYEGRGIKKDIKLASQYIQKAIKFSPEDKAYHYNAAFIARDLGDITKANEYLKKACELGEEKACNKTLKAKTAVKDKDYNEDMQDIKNIIKDIKSFCDDGFASCDNLDEFQQEYQEFKSSCDSGDLDGCNKLGHWYFGNSQSEMVRPAITKKHYQKALKVWDKACKSNHADSCYRIGYSYYDRDNYRAAKQYVSKACNLGYGDACGLMNFLKQQGY